MENHILDVLTLVSSDKRFPIDAAGLMARGEVRLVHTFRTGSECLRALSLDDLNTRRLVLIDNLISDISPANLCDAIRMAHPDLNVILVAEQDDVEGVQRAMLAGAKATIARNISVAEFSRIIERVIEASFTTKLHMMGQAASSGGGAQASIIQHFHANLGDYGQRAVLVPIIGARGGAGKSTISTSLACLAAEANIDTALIDFDLQFGDLSFLFGNSVDRVKLGTKSKGGLEARTDEDDLFAFLEAAAASSSAVAMHGLESSLRRFGKQITPNLRLYAPRAVPEKTESLAQLLPAALDKLRSEHELLLVNTGSYWTLFHAELLEQSDLALCILDQSIVGVRATSELRDHCRRLGIPPSRLLFVMNKVHSSGLRDEDVAEVLMADKVFSIRDEGMTLARLFDSGDFAQLGSQTSFMAQLFELLDEIAIRSDLCIHDAVSLRYAMRRESSQRKGLLRRA